MSRVSVKLVKTVLDGAPFGTKHVESVLADAENRARLGHALWSGDPDGLDCVTSSVVARGQLSQGKAAHVVGLVLQRLAAHQQTPKEALTGALSRLSAIVGPRSLRRTDYEPPPFLVLSTQLSFDIREHDVGVHNTMWMQPNPECDDPDHPLVLDVGDAVDVEEIHLGGKPTEWLRIGNRIVLWPQPDRAEDLAVRDTPTGAVREDLPVYRVEVRNRIRPQDNRNQLGMFQYRRADAGRSLLTQCEFEGLRQITPFPDRPDVLTTFSVCIEADPNEFTQLVSNGVYVPQPPTTSGRKVEAWHDPLPKPSYLFALAAGRFELRSRKIEFTGSGDTVQLQVLCDLGLEDGCDATLDLMEATLRWEMDFWGLHYPSAGLSAVVTNYFSYGGMENAGLIFLTGRFGSVHASTTIDQDRLQAEHVVAHEVLHHQTGNRAPGRGWWNVGFYEGLNTYRDQLFAELLHGDSRRIDHVKHYQNYQFALDASQRAQAPISEEAATAQQHVSITAYNKGAAIMRMLATMIGLDTFKNSLRSFLSRFEHRSSSHRDFLRVASEISERDLSDFQRWYYHVGIPVVEVTRDQYDPHKNTLTVTFRQTSPRRNGRPQGPLHIPLSIAVVGNEGEVAVGIHGTADAATEHVVALTQAAHTLVLTGVPNEGVALSLNRGFSAPVHVVQGSADDHDRSWEDALTLLAYDNDAVVRCEASGRLAVTLMVHRAIAANEEAERNDQLAQYLRALTTYLERDEPDPGVAARVLELPTEADLADAWYTIAGRIDPLRLRKVRMELMRQLAGGLLPTLCNLYRRAAEETHTYDARPTSIAWRRLKFVCLDFLLSIHPNEGAVSPVAEVRRLFRAKNMDERFNALSLMTKHPALFGGAANDLEDFQLTHEDERELMNKWLSLVASGSTQDALERVRNAMVQDAFNSNLDVCWHLLVRGFADNFLRFHAPDGSGYRFLGDAIIEVALEEEFQRAASLLSGFSRRWRFTERVQRMILDELTRIQEILGESDSPEFQERLSLVIMEARNR